MVRDQQSKCKLDLFVYRGLDALELIPQVFVRLLRPSCQLRAAGEGVKWNARAAETGFTLRRSPAPPMRGGRKGMQAAWHERPASVGKGFLEGGLRTCSSRISGFSSHFGKDQLKNREITGFFGIEIAIIFCGSGFALPQGNQRRRAVV